MLLLAKGDEIGEDGFYWLLVQAANCFGNDKISLDDRAEWALNKHEEFLSYAQDPYNNTGWFKADKPFVFLATCMELNLLADWVAKGNEQETFMSCLPVALDGSNNGSQHLAAMARDEQLAPYVNLVPLDTPGDLYAYVGKLLWDELEMLEMRLPAAVFSRLDNVLEETTRLQTNYDTAPRGSEKKANAWEAVQTYRNNNRVLREALFPAYWRRIKDPKLIRKIVKRGVMTLSYGATPFGMGQQIWDDTRDMNEYLGLQEKLWSNQLGALLHKVSRKRLNKLGSMLQLFETVADRFNEREEHIEWLTPFTNFPVVQNYRKPTVARTKLSYAGQSMNIQLEDWDNSVLSKDSQRLGASPNLVHSFDACHLMLTADGCDFPLSLCHDSFGATAGNISTLFRVVREKFVEFYEAEPLEDVLGQLDCLDLAPKKGELDIKKVLESDFAFS